MILGKKAPRFDRRTLQLAKYLKPGAAPVSAAYQEKVSSWPMLLNDQLGDCVCAAAGHMIQEWTEYAGDPIVPTDDQILKAYEVIGGYNPNDPSTDQGCDMLTALNVWRQQGIAGRKILAFVQLETGNLEQLKLATFLFGNAYLGLALPVTAQGQSGEWFIDDTNPEAAVPDSWGGHCVPSVGYDEILSVVTWGQMWRMSPNFYARYNDEAYAVLSEDWLDQAGEACNGFDLEQLKADLAEVTA